MGVPHPVRVKSSESRFESIFHTSELAQPRRERVALSLTLPRQGGRVRERGTVMNFYGLALARGQKVRDRTYIGSIFQVLDGIYQRLQLLVRRRSGSVLRTVQ